MGVGSLDIRLLFNGTDTEAGLLTEWERDTAFDGRMPMAGHPTVPITWAGPVSAKGDDTDGDGKHSHVPLTHDHGSTAHAHLVYSGSSSGGSARHPTPYFFFGVYCAKVTHWHNSSFTGFATIPYANTLITISDEFWHPAHQNLIVIKPKAGFPDASIPEKAVVFSTETISSGFAIKTWAGDFIKTAAAGGNAGTGTTKVTHSSPTHRHTYPQHLHTIVLQPTASPNLTGSAVAFFFKSEDHQYVGGDASTDSTDDLQDVAVTFDDGDVLPSHYELLAYENNSGSDQDPQTGMVFMYVGTDSTDLPDDYALVESNIYNRVIRVTETQVDAGDYAGEDEHTHDADTHKHLHNASHTHVINVWDSHRKEVGALGSEAYFNYLTASGESHASWTIDNRLPIIQNTVVDIDTGGTVPIDGRAPWRTALMLLYTEPAAPSYSVVKAIGHILGTSGPVVIVHTSRLERICA